MKGVPTVEARPVEHGALRLEGTPHCRGEGGGAGNAEASRDFPNVEARGVSMERWGASLAH